MAKKHDENQDIQILSKRFKVNSVQKLIHASHSQIIGNKTWGRIDYLTHYCGYALVWGDTFLVNKENYSKADKKLAELLGKTGEDMVAYRENLGLVWHECNDMKTMQLVPKEFNQFFTHFGGVGEINLLFDLLEGLFK